jgi:hypothetical protein
MLYSEIIAVCSQIHTKHKFTVWAERTAQKTHSFWVIKTSQLMVYSEIIAHKYNFSTELTAL